MAPTAASSSAPASRVVTDDLNRRVEMRGTPQRIVALSPAIVEVLFAIGVTPVGRPSGASYPEAAKQVADIGTSSSPNYERISDLKPDLIIGNVTARDAQVPQLERLGVPVVLFNVAKYGDVLKCIRLAGEITNKEADAQKAAKEIEDEVSAIRAKIPAKKPTVFIFIGSGKAFYGALPGSYVGSLAEELGATNVATGAEDSRYRGFTLYSVERLAEKDPDVIVAIRPTAGPRRAPSALPTLQTDSRWQSFKAVKAERVYEVSPQLFVHSPGPRVGEALAELAAILYPEVFGSGR